MFCFVFIFLLASSNLLFGKNPAKGITTEKKIIQNLSIMKLGKDSNQDFTVMIKVIRCFYVVSNACS